MNALPASTKNDLLRRLHANENAIRSFGVRRIGLFGSFRRDEARADSDVDLLVEFQPGETTFDHFMGLSFFCEALLGRRVEIVTPNSLSPYLGPRILQEVEYAIPPQELTLQHECSWNSFSSVRLHNNCV